MDIDEEECLEMESVMHAVELNMHLLSSLLSSHACNGPYEWCIFVEMEKQNTLPHMYINSWFLNQTGNDSQINTSLAMLPQSRPQPQAMPQAVQVGCLN